MSGIATAVVGSQIVGGMMASDAQQGAADTAANAQIQSSKLGIDEQKRQFDAIQALLKPYVDAGTGALGAQKDLIGLNGNDAQQAAIGAIQNSPQFAALTKQGENSILANASATGGLRGGNIQRALAEFRPNLLSALIEQQFGRLGGFTSLGQNSAVGVGNAGMTTGNNVASLLQQAGAAEAGAALAGGRAQAGMLNTLGSAAGTFAGLGGFKNIGGAGSSSFLDNNAGVLNQGLTPADLYGAF